MRRATLWPYCILGALAVALALLHLNVYFDLF